MRPASESYKMAGGEEWHPVWWPARSSKPLFGGGPVEGGFDSHAAPPTYLREVVAEAYVNGVSTRKVERLVEQLGMSL